MQIELSPMAKKIRPSLMFRFLERAKEMENQGLEIIHLEKGEPELGPPRGMIEAARKAMEEGHNLLTPAQGIMELRRAIAEDLRTEYGISVDPSKEVAVVPGAKFGVYATFAATLFPGDEVLCLSPYFPPYREIVEMLGGSFVPIPLLKGGKCRLTRENIEEKLTPRARFLFLNYPHNPTGWVPTEEEMDLLLELVEKKGLIGISDEVYDHLVFDGLSHRPFFGFPNLRDQLVLVNSFSKRFAITGWRIGYCAGPPNVINGIARVQQNTTTCAHAPSQMSVAWALREERSYSGVLAKIYGERKAIFVERLKEIKGITPIQPKGGLFIFASISELAVSSIQFAEELLAQEHVAISPGAAFGHEWDQYIRFSMTEEPGKIDEALDRLKRFTKRGC